MDTWINYHHLYYFKTIAEEGSVSKAAEKLRLGQPTLSAQLKQFEDTIGIKLFDRQHKKLTLTEQGKVALEYAQNIFKMGNEMYEALHDRMSPNRIHLQIGALDSLTKEILLELSKAAYKIGPCSISLIEGKPEEMLRELAAHRIDLFVTNFIPSTLDTKHFFYKSIMKNPVSIYGAKEFKGLSTRFPQSVSNKPFILPTHDSKLRRDFEHWVRLNGLTVDSLAETQDVSLQKLMASEGLGLIPTTLKSVESLVKNKTLYKIGALTEVYEEVFLISAQRKITNPIAAKLLKN
ncbi:LysR family transcriptional regulator [Pseudobdellovibrio exovorus]|uniref:HTH lysR-type domain-containing protein n=1 Tax=Pseudobdellovibrio exovorus JSS TaxID=1184267 RepID=M4VDV4_9BACT|nr:LysR family transcriptional regulator [Pseudobdellovibrio exovorus]AGH96221.1 hypothetical protein A11Q_2005 [Pseudobdellovibrio exovorus JSS]